MRRVYVISDLHLGGDYAEPPGDGRRGFRLCTHPDAIVDFIKLVTERLHEGPTELVINGDMVDFLAEKGANGWSAFTQDPVEAVRKFNDIIGRERDRAVFDALGCFMKKGGALRILLGNHDIELSLPDVRGVFYRALHLEPSHDFQFLYDGEAYTVGDVLIEHGNRYDAWNQVDYDGLRHVRSMQSRRQKIPKKDNFVWPAGSEMVEAVINPIKKDYPFIDLLKPEEATAVPVLLALEPDERTRLAKVAKLRFSTLKHGMEDDAKPKYGGNISSTGNKRTSKSEPSANELLEATVREVLGNEADAFLAAIADEDDDDLPPGGNISSGGSIRRRFGLWRLLSSRKKPAIERRMSALLQALRGLQLNKSFDTANEAAPEYLKAARDLARGHFRYVVFGHTHLPKKVDLGGDRIYLNSGTWADVLKFPTDILDAPLDVARERLTAFVQKMATGDFNGLTLDDRSYIVIEINERDRASHVELASFKSGKLV